VVGRDRYLPDAPRAKETVGFDQGERDFRPGPGGQSRFGVQMCREMMFPEHSRALGLAGAHLVVQPRASGPSKKWNVASEDGRRQLGLLRDLRQPALLRARLVLRQQMAAVARSRGIGRDPEQPFVTADIALAEKSKSTYPRDLQRTYDV
jgi:predicted amidohydrolase